MSNVWDGMSVARLSGSGNYLPPDFRGLVKINACKLNADSFKGDLAFIAEFEIVESNLASVPIGCSRSLYQGKLADRQIRETALGEILHFVACALGVQHPDEKMKEQIQAYMNTIVGEDNPLAGRLIRVETWNKKTKKGEDFTKHRWSVAS